MKSARHILLLLTLLLVPLGASAQNHIRAAMERAKAQREAMARRQVQQAEGSGGSQGFLRMVVENGDTTYVDNLSPIYILSRSKYKSEKDWVNYYKMVWRFARVYPYAQASGKLVRHVDSTLNAENYRGLRKERYISAIQKQLFKDFEGAFRKMTITQGALLLKLINRETGITAYAIIKDYKSGITASFWQGVAKLFDNDLKAEYDPAGADKELEELVQIWQAGEFPALYWSIFWEDAPKVDIPPQYLR